MANENVSSHTSSVGWGYFDRSQSGWMASLQGQWKVSFDDKKIEGEELSLVENEWPMRV